MPFSQYKELFQQAIQETGVFTPDPDAVNAVLVFPDTTGELVQNEVGNWVPSEATITIECALKSDSRPKEQYYPGINANEEPLRGRCVNPVLLPAQLTAGSEAQATINGKPGSFRLVRVLESPYSVAEVTGDRIEGIFREGDDG
jgi:hypothetical protein